MANRNMQSWLSFLPIALIMFGLLYVNVHKPLKTIIVEEKSESTSLYFTGIVSPLSYHTILSPAEGVVTQVKVPYGAWVKKGDLLYVLDSPSLAQNYRQNMADLIRATNTFQNTQFQHTGNEEMFKMGLISKVSFMDNTQQLENSVLELDEVRAKILTLLKITGNKRIDFQALSLDKIENIREILKKPIRTVYIYAKYDGVLYFPSKTFNDETEKPIKLARGTNVKEGQALAVIGDMKGLLMDVFVNENDFHKISMGQTATISGSAFPDIELEGTVKNISRQSNSAQSDMTPLYTISVIVPELTKKQRATIEVGMSAEITFTTQNPPSISIPIAALVQKKGDYWVKTINKKRQIKEVKVIPGPTSEDSVQIIKGLAAGEKIVLPN